MPRPRGAKREVWLALYNLRSAHNVGAIFRTAATLAAVTKIWLIGLTPAPRDRFGRDNAALAKTALGAEVSLPWSSVKNFSVLAKKVRAGGGRIVAVEQAPGSIDYRQLRVMSPLTLVLLGNEITGLPKNVLRRCDTVAEIPMGERKESLNVSVAAGIFLFRLLQN